MGPLSAQLVRLSSGWEFRRWQDGTVLSAEQLTRCQQLYGEHTYTAHRADVHQAIRSRVPADSLRLGKRCVEVMLGQTSSRLRFEDGEIVEADIVIGADGIHSLVRAALADPSPATYSGICAFRALVPRDLAPEFARQHTQTLWIGPGRHLVHYPVSAGKYINLVAFAPAGEQSVESWTATATVAEFLAEFDRWDQRLVELIRSAGTPGRWALLDRAPLARWSLGTTTLLGDAAHPMFPFFAQGAAQALEDAAVLTQCLVDDLGDPARALARYEAVRIPRTRRLQEVSHTRSMINHLPDGRQQRERDRAFSDRDPLVENAWIYEYDPEVAVAGAQIA
jgi:salicylate hydroxylase